MTTFAKYYQQLKEFTEDLFLHPELGYKEHRTSEKVIEELTRIHPSIELSKFSETGIKTFLSTDKKRTMAFIAELDAVYAPTHFQADPQTGLLTIVGILLRWQSHCPCMIITLKLETIRN